MNENTVESAGLKCHGKALTGALYKVVKSFTGTNAAPAFKRLLRYRSGLFVHSAVAFKGSHRGAIVLAAPVEFCSLLNMKTQGQTAGSANGVNCDAMRALVGDLAEHSIRCMFGEGAGIKCSPPRIEMLRDEEWARLVDCVAKGFVVEKIPFIFYARLEKTEGK